MRQTNVRGTLSLRGFRKLRTGAIVATGVILLGLGFLAPTVSANEQDGVWVARTVAEVKADIQNIDNLSHYTIKWGDTLSAISGATGLSVDSLVEINRIANRDLIFANNKLYFSEEAFLKDGNTEVKRQRVSIDNSGSCQSYEVETKIDTVTGEQTTTVKQTTPVVVETPAVSVPKSETSVSVAPKADESATPALKTEEPSAPAPKVEEPAATTPKAEEPAATDSKADEPAATDSKAGEPVVTTPKAEEPAGTEPKTDEPAVTTPKVEEPAATTPKAEEPAATDPKADEPAGTTSKEEEPAATEPKTDEPAGTTPKVEEPVATEPKTDESAGTTPKVEEPAATTPKAEEPVATEPKADEPAGTTPKADEPVTTMPKAEEPAATTPKAEEPAGTEPKTDEPAVTTPKAEEPAATTPKAEEPAGTEPKTDEPATPAPKVEEPEATTPKAEEPAATEPKADEPVVATPKADEPATTTPKADEPAGTEPKTDEPVATTPKTEEPAATTPKTDEPAGTTPKAEEPAATTPKAENSSEEVAPKDEKLEGAKKDGQDIIEGIASSKLSEIEKVKDEAEKTKLKEKLNVLKEEALAAINNAKDYDAAVATADEYQTKIDEIDVPGEELPAPNYNKDNLTNGRNEGTTIDNGSTVIGHGSGEATATSPTQPATEERSTSTASPTQPSSTSEGTSSFRNAPSVQARARRVARSTSEPDGTVNISYNFAGMPDIHGFLSDPGEDNTVTIPAGTSEAQAKELVKEKIQAKIKDLATRGYHVKNDIIFEQDTTVKNYNYVVTFTKEATGTSGFRMAPAVQPRASRNRRSVEQPASQKVKVNVFYNFDKMKDIAGFLGDIDGTSLEIAEGSTNEQVKVAVKSQVDAKKEELSKRGYTFKEDYVYQANGKDYNYVVTFSKATK
ncbi:LysM peptidoglycan-binding domain-containing protein [Streptococcus mitis]|uniref:LysM peptidoglycan-binding domain-containing protein n=1 Tax=Streptococcus mitis TaxID=28037 RepID=A0A6I1TY60_STRMT|nr:LysM domain-containing protein [Streptococcus mitis]MQQ30601.1 LysM peptidoglycan-binding domain-containing protein [Streptococcus mitis]